jgi:LDH2 family malate/lactate/ureidoglycolate dehydrogenase
MSERYSSQDLHAFAVSLLVAVGMPKDRAEIIAEILLEGDLLGHTTHGLQLLGPYLKKIQAQEMTLTGQPDIIRDSSSTIVLDGRYLPGPWLVVNAIDLAVCRLPRHGVVTIVIQRSHHIACLEAYLKRAADRGLVMLLMSSDPSVGTVSPPGGLKGIYTPNPIAAGIPTDGDPILIDISTSTTSNGLTMRLHKKKERLPDAWVKTANGEATDDPGALFTEPPGTLLPLGGLDLGYKGFALGILIEALTSALAGHGRADGPDRWGASIFLQLIDPDAFGGKERFRRETSWFVNACHQTPVRPGDPPVRVPGERALQRRKEQLANGVDLYPGIMDSLRTHAEQLHIKAPPPLGSNI